MRNNSCIYVVFALLCKFFVSKAASAAYDVYKYDRDIIEMILELEICKIIIS